jgi:hypothetical protein
MTISSPMHPPPLGKVVNPPMSTKREASPYQWPNAPPGQ